MIGEKMQAALNKQVNAELYSSYLYLSMAAYLESENLSGMAHWMRVQAKEEQTHAMKFFDFVVERGGRVTLSAIDAPETQWGSALAAFTAAYEHERKVTQMIDDLVKLAGSEGDTASAVFLQWFVAEQVEEEKNADEIVQKLRMIKDSPHGLLMLDRALGERSE